MYLCHGFNGNFKVSKYFHAHIIEAEIFPGFEKTILIKGHKSDILKVANDLRKTGYYKNFAVRFSEMSPYFYKRRRKCQFLFPLRFAVNNDECYKVEKRYYGGKKK